jgi:hypothetical protein
VEEEETMGKAKPDGWENDLKDLIAQGKNHKDCEMALIAIYGAEEGKVGASTYQRHKKNLTGGPEIDNKLKDIKELKSEEKPKGKPRPAWNKGKQKAADETKLAQLINKGMYHSIYPFCKNKELKEEDVQEVNMGGAIVGSIQYFVPDLNLDHPLIVLATRGIMLYLRFKAICNKVSELKAKVVQTIGGSGIKPEFLEAGKK